MGIKIITDSTSYIPDEILKELDIDVVPLNVNYNNGTFLETEVNNAEYYSYIERTGEIPKSSQPSIESLYNIFEKYVSKGDKIVAVFISRFLSGTYNTANMVKDMVAEKYNDAKIEIINSNTCCMEMGYVVIEAAKAAAANLPFQQVVDAANDVMTRNKFLFIPKGLKYLQIGGRIGNAASLLGTALQIKPILTVRDGVATVFGKVMSKKRAVQKMVDEMLKDSDEKGLDQIIVHHIDVEAEAKELAEMISQKIGKQVGITPIGPIIGLHVGPGAIGIAYTTKIP